MIDINKFVASLIEFSPQQSMKYIKALEDQGLKYKDGEIVPIDETFINPSEFDKRLNALLKEFEELPKNEIIDSLEFYLKAVKKETPFDLMRLKELAKPEVPQDKGLTEFEKALKGIIKRHDGWMSSFDDYELKDDAKELLAIARKEFLDKACKWLDENMEDLTRFYEDIEMHDVVISDYTIKKEFIEAFKKVMEE